MRTQTVNLFYDLNDPATPIGSQLTEHNHIEHVAPPEAQLVDIAAADSTGFMLDRASRYYIRRSKRPPDGSATSRRIYRHFGKLGAIIDGATHMILATHRGLGSGGLVPTPINWRRCSTRFVPMLFRS